MNTTYNYCHACDEMVATNKWQHHVMEHRQEDDLNDQKNRGWYDQQVQEDFQKECDEFWHNAKDDLR